MSETRLVDKDIKNKWREEWLLEEDVMKRPFGQWLNKISEPGAAFCRLCNSKLVYKSNGKKSITIHSKDPMHMQLLNAQKHTSTMPAAKPVYAPVSKADRVTNAKVRTCSFLAEHCLPLSLAPDLIAFCKKLAEDKDSLEQLSMCRKTATYTTTHGVAAALKDDLFKKNSKQLTSH
eukprot:TRINITY_DN13554_c0_g1_i12.p1 TRINITY_DN13554_c0_g1~~TRINITY_DN13554_c0_g1_i12.p1  ORF type:complete len:176 (+),score=34.05 TRINITY_DN13554_c0_g1_i12:199-726(+)